MHKTVEKVNTLNSFVIPDEDRSVLRSDMGNKMTYNETFYTQTQAIQKKVTKKAKLLAEPNVKRWYNNVARGSPVTAEINLRRLSKFCEDNKLTPLELAELGQKDIRAATNLLQDHISWMESQTYATQYIQGTVTAIKSWLVHFDVFIKRRIKVANADSTPTLEKERVPDGQSLQRCSAGQTLEPAQ